MKIKRLLLVGCFILGLQSNYGQNINWKPVDSQKKFSSNELMLRDNFPNSYELFSTDFNSLKETLKSAPAEATATSIQEGLMLNLPGSEGMAESYYVFYSPVMEEGLAVQFPELRSYKAISAKNPLNVMYISISPEFGMHMMGNNINGETYFVDTYTKDKNNYIVYKLQNIQNRNSFQCFNDDQVPSVPVVSENATKGMLMNDGNLRTFRLALAGTVEYAAFHVNAAGLNNGTDVQKKGAVLAAMNALVTRLNSIYEREVASKFVLVENNIALIFLTTDSFDNTNTQVLINQSQTVITQVIGANKFDIGHTLATETGGGLAALGSICVNASKAKGVSGVPAPVGDPFVVTIVSHEVGHQLGASHTFNDNENGSCQGNRSDNTAAEPGSGTTIMSYSGLCDPNNVNGNITDAYFHYLSLGQMRAVLTSSQCAVLTANNNPAPIIQNQLKKTIPHSTPFVLTAEATDANNQTTLTYSWEQLDVEESVQPPAAENTVGPNFRSFPPTGRKYRSFPSENVVLAGTPQEDNGVVSSKWERLTNVPERTFLFGVTVRDNNALLGGQSKSIYVPVKTANAGPFLITYPNNITDTPAVNWYSGTQQNITWNVAGTTGNGVNTANVKISYSLNNGTSYTTLLESTPNDGSEMITLPVLDETNVNVRIKIEAVGNIYYTVSKRLTIYGKNVASTDFELDNFKLFPNPTSDLINLSFTSESNTDIVFKIYDFRGRKVYNHTVKNNGSIQHSIDMSKMSSGVYILNISDGNKTMSKKIIRK